MGALFAGLLSLDITVQNPGYSTDRYNRANEDWSIYNPEPRPSLPGGLPTTLGLDAGPGVVVKGWFFISQRRMEETYNNQDQATSDGVCFLEPTAPVTPYSRLVILGDRYEVFGIPSLVNTPAGPHHWEVRVKRFTG